jgi:hypothetical protein
LHSDKKSRDGVNPEVQLPKNLYVIGTVNVDETTYAFSPKVLDRANVIEFRVDENQVATFLRAFKELDTKSLIGRGKGYEFDLVTASQNPVVLTKGAKDVFDFEINLLFRVMAEHNLEFGFRTIKDIARFVFFHDVLSTPPWDMRESMDAQIVQKVMPKISGSRSKIEQLLLSLSYVTMNNRTPGPTETVSNLYKRLLTESTENAKPENVASQPLDRTGGLNPGWDPRNAYFPLSFDKTVRMLRKVRRDGFASYAEA